MEWKLLQFNQARWQYSAWGENALILRATDTGAETVLHVQAATKAIEEALIPGVIDVVMGYDSVTLIIAQSITSAKDVIKSLAQLPSKHRLSGVESRTYRIPVCYEKGMDWKEVEQKLLMPREKIIAHHVSQTYTLAMMGFLPGFFYFSGLPEALHCSRKENPRQTVPAGAVGIGGAQTGLYSFSSPGGWQIIGQTPQVMFDIERTPPTQLQPGDQIMFYRISSSAFEEWERNDHPI